MLLTNEIDIEAHFLTNDSYGTKITCMKNVSTKLSIIIIIFYSKIFDYVKFFEVLTLEININDNNR